LGGYPPPSNRIQVAHRHPDEFGRGFDNGPADGVAWQAREHEIQETDGMAAALEGALQDG
jgi:hypothetical protein